MARGPYSIDETRSVTLRIPKEIDATIRRLARDDDRNVTSFIVSVLRKLAKDAGDELRHDATPAE